MDLVRLSAQRDDPRLLAARLGFDDPRAGDADAALFLIETAFAPTMAISLEAGGGASELVAAWEPDGLAGGTVRGVGVGLVWDAVRELCATDTGSLAPLDANQRDGMVVTILARLEGRTASHRSQEPGGPGRDALIDVLRLVQGVGGKEVADVLPSVAGHVPGAEAAGLRVERPGARRQQLDG